jgi:hypothetical protein
MNSQNRRKSNANSPGFTAQASLNNSREFNGISNTGTKDLNLVVMQEMKPSWRHGDFAIIDKQNCTYTCYYEFWSLSFVCSTWCAN